MITVTMTAPLGSGGRELAQIVAETLGLTLVDHQIVDDAARALRLPENEVAHAEQPPHLLDRLFRTLAAQPGLAEWGQSAAVTTPAPDELCRAALHHEIERWADQGSCVILGHGGQMALGRRPRVIHLLCHASREDRVEMVCRDEWLGPREAERRVEAADRCQEEWHRAAYGANLYDTR
ncbi:MAG: cytidylate kinase-like family protein, partial [Chloroflexi bacterium]|nr:cytidylate kinase-like family protein [Chloroflexota bacterium]